PLPAAAITTTRTLSSRNSESNASCSASSISLVSRFICCGRFMVSVQMPSRSSRRRMDESGCGTALMEGPFLSGVDRARGLGFFAQHEFLDLPRRCLGQLAEDHGARRLELRQML